MIIHVKTLPSNFKPYPFKDFKINAISLRQAVNLGDASSLSDLRSLIQELTGDTIDASLLVPIDIRYIISLLSFHAYPNQSWLLDHKCPVCGKDISKTVTLKDFPPIPSLTDEDSYPLTIDDGVHIYEIGYASVEAVEALIAIGTSIGDVHDQDSVVLTAIDFIEPYVLTIDGSKDGIREKLLSIEDFGLLSLISTAIKEYFVDSDTYSEFTCPHCSEKYNMPMSAVEVTRYVPFLDKTAASRYKTNFRV